MTKWNIWEEGFAIGEDRATARFVAIVEAETFQEACDIQYKDNKLYDPVRRTFWGCRLFDNEEDARAYFG